MRARPRHSALALAAILSSCGGKPKVPAAAPAPAARGAAPAGLITEVTPSRLLPELVGMRGVIAIEEGHRRILVDRMRLIARPDGSFERAAELLPGGNVSSIALPSRLGGGYLFHVNAGGGTEIWRADGWLDKLRPLTRRNEVVTHIVPGFDRLYVRLSSGNRLIALDPGTGAVMPLGPLPSADSYGMLAFADGWRAVVDADLRGPLATFDGGATWRPLGIQERAQGIGIFDGDPAVIVSGGRYVVDARGVVTHRTDSRGRSRRADDGDPAAQKPGPLGKRPLRAAVEDGWPDAPGTAVVARNGALGRVSLRDGAVLALAEGAYPEARASCHAVRLGDGVGFICGERDAATAIYAFVPPLAMREVMRFDKPRFVSASGNGALVIRGPCEGAGASTEADARWYCVRAKSGATREIRVKGFDLGVERVVALADGRVAVLVPPRGGSAGDVSVVNLDGSASKAELKLPAEPVDAAQKLRRGLWLDGFEERSPGVLGGWVEAGGPVVGVQIALDGKVKAGDVKAEAGGAIFGGRFAVLLFDGARAMETTDGGMTYRGFDLPDRDDEARAVPSRAAGPVGAALPGWVRVGWGEPASSDDMKQAQTPPLPYAPLKVSPTIALACDVGTVATPPLPEAPRAGRAPAPPPPPPSRLRPSRFGLRPPPVRAAPSSTPWSPFRNTPPPALGPEETGVDHGGGGDVPWLRAYAWGKKGADWTRAGRWLLRFDDRFDPAGGVRSGAAAAPPWADELSALEAIAGTGVQWYGVLDPGGRALLASACHGSSCSLYAAAEGQPALPIRDAAGRGSTFVRPLPNGAVRVGDTWFYLLQPSSGEYVTLWRVDLGAARPLATYQRPTTRFGYDPPRLVRRAVGSGIALLVAGQPEPGEPAGVWHIIPVDPETGALGESTPLIRRDFAIAAPPAPPGARPLPATTVPLPRCAPEQDGWLVMLKPDTAVTVDVDNARATIEHVEMRVRVDPDRACVEALTAVTPGLFALESSGKGAPRALTAPPGRRAGVDPAAAVPLAVHERLSGRRWGMSCKILPRKP